MAEPTKVVVHSENRILKDRFNVDELIVSYERFAGGMIEKKRRLIFERGDSAAALLYDPDKGEVILTRQFRAPTLQRPSGGSLVGEHVVPGSWLLETAAGIIQDGETPRATIAREVREETGYQITHAIEIATFFSSPGGTSERIFLYYAEVRAADKQEEGGGAPDTGEDIKTVAIPLDLFIKQLINREFEDPKLIIAGQWLKDRQGRMLAESTDDASEVERFKVKSTPGKIIGYRTGSILAARDVDVWVSSTTTDMMMDRFSDRSVSAAIRFQGARKFQGNKHRVLEDTIGEALRSALSPRNFVQQAEVIDTTPGELAYAPYRVKRIFHVAAVEGVFGESGSGSKPSITTLEKCVDNVLEAIESNNGWIVGRTKYRSVIFPMLGTGPGGLLVELVAPKLIERAIDFFKRNPRARLEEIYFLAYSLGDRDVLEGELRRSAELEHVGAQSTPLPVVAQTGT